MKIDVAVPSYKKPESLLYTLMTLKKVAGDLIDAVYINDDCSNDGSVEIYNDRRVREYFSPWKLNVRVNTRNVHISQVYVPGYRVDYMDWKFMLTKWHRFIDPRVPHNRHDIRYQYALDNTDKKYLLIIHDEIDNIEHELQDKLNCSATIHIDPIVTDNKEVNEMRSQIEEITRNLDRRLSIHDFRIVEGPTHTNLIFDIAVPFECKLTNVEITNLLKERIRNMDDGNYCAVIQIDRVYS